MKLLYKHIVALLFLELTSSYLYWYPRPGYKYRIGKIKRTPNLIPSQMPFYTKKINATNSTL